MPHKPDSNRTFPKILNQRSILQSLGWLGGIGVLSGGVVFAQTSSPSDAPTVPSAQDLLMPDAPPEVIPAAPAPVAAPKPATEQAPGSLPAAIAPEPMVEFTPAPSPSSRPVVPATPTADAPISLPSDLAEQVQTLTPTDPQEAPYIDTTDYRVGATSSPDQPSVVVSERSTGCQVTLQSGQSVPNTLCTSPQHSTAIARQSFSPTGSGLRSVNVGAIRLSSNGIGFGRDYYNVTQRPLGLPGNGNLQLMFPLSIPVSITSAFGWRVHPISGVLRFHYGSDLGAPLGTPVLAAYTGQVAIADFMQGYGLAVVMRHNNNVAETLYAHLSEIFVQPGEWVEQGQVIGRVGSTGNSTGPHLHFEFRQQTSEGWVALNPGAMLEQALATFSHPFQTAQAVSPTGQFIGFGLNGFDQLLAALKLDPASLNFQSVQNVEQAIALDYDLNEVKEWSKQIKQPKPVKLD